MSNSVFLCVKQSNNYNCYKFNSFIEADNYYYIKNFNNNTPSTMVSIFKYLPIFIQNLFIDYKLKNIFVKSKIITDNNFKK